MKGQTGPDKPDWPDKDSPNGSTQDNEVTWMKVGRVRYTVWFRCKFATVWAAMVLAVFTGVCSAGCVFIGGHWKAGLILGFICLTTASFSSNLASSLEAEEQVGRFHEE